MSSRGYYLDSLRAWQSKLQKEHRLLMARYGRMERMGHPAMHDQGRCIDLNKRFLEIIREALDEASAPDPLPPPRNLTMSEKPMRVQLRRTKGWRMPFPIPNRR